MTMMKVEEWNWAKIFIEICYSGSNKDQQVLPYLVNRTEQLDRELLIDPPSTGEFCTLWFSKTTLYMTQNDTW